MLLRTVKNGDWILFEKPRAENENPLDNKLVNAEPTTTHRLN